MRKEPTGGRPRLVPEQEDLETIEELAERGLTLEDIAGAIGVGRDWLAKRVNDIESDVLLPYRRGRAKRAAKLLDKYSELEDAEDLAVQERVLRKQLAWLGYHKEERPAVQQTIENDVSEGEIKIDFNVIETRDTDLIEGETYGSE